MAIASTAVWEVRTTGNDANGGMYDASLSGAGIDYSQQDSPQLSVTDGVTNGTTTVTSSTGGFTSAMIGNGLNITGDGVYIITARASTNSITVDRNTGSGTGKTLKVGGALATPGKAASLATVAGQKLYVKAGTYTLTTSTAGAGGPVVLAANQQILLEGYNASRGDLGTPPVISAGAVTGINIITCGGLYNSVQYVVNLKVDGNSRSTVSGFVGTNTYDDICYKCQAVNCTVCGFKDNLMAHQCIATSCDKGFSLNGIGVADGCVAKSCTSIGFDVYGSGQIFRCIADSCASGFAISYQTKAYDCVAYNSSGSGFATSIYDYGIYINCLAVSNAAYGFDNGTGNNASFFNCAAYNNTSGNLHTVAFRVSSVTALTADPFVNAAGGNFALNNTSGGGAACRAAGFPGVFPNDTTTGYIDIGAVQHGPATLAYVY